MKKFRVQVQYTIWKTVIVAAKKQRGLLAPFLLLT